MMHSVYKLLTTTYQENFLISYLVWKSRIQVTIENAKIPFNCFVFADLRYATSESHVLKFSFSERP